MPKKGSRKPRGRRPAAPSGSGPRRPPPSSGPRRPTSFERSRTRAGGPLNEPAWLTLALDALARHRAAGEPLEVALKAAQRRSRPGSLDRRRAGDAVFGWGRRRAAAEAAVAEVVADHGGVMPARRALDAAEVALALSWAGHDVELALPPPLDALLDEPPSPGGGPALPAWLERELAELDDSEALFRALAERAPVGLCVDPRRATREEMAEALAALGAEVELSAVSSAGLRARGRVRLDELPAKLRRAVWPMDEASQRVALAVEARPGERILDLCAGGGGKARWLVTTGCELVCADVDRRRLLAAKKRAGDAASYVLADGAAPPFAEGSFDAVLVDAPCTGTGTLRRTPDQAARLEPADLEQLVERQQTLLAAATSLVRPGGRVVYATCSLLPAENQSVVEAVTAAHAGELEVDEPEVFRPDRQGTDGFFLVRGRRRSR